jgi:hypothetical protein
VRDSPSNKHRRKKAAEVQRSQMIEHQYDIKTANQMSDSASSLAKSFGIQD